MAYGDIYDQEAQFRESERYNERLRQRLRHQDYSDNEIDRIMSPLDSGSTKKEGGQ